MKKKKDMSFKGVWERAFPPPKPNEPTCFEDIAKTLAINKPFLDIIHEDMAKDQNRRKRSKAVKKRKGTK